jgi:hypothetical protein
MKMLLLRVAVIAVLILDTSCIGILVTSFDQQQTRRLLFTGND